MDVVYRRADVVLSILNKRSNMQFNSIEDVENSFTGETVYIDKLGNEVSQEDNWAHIIKAVNAYSTTNYKGLWLSYERRGDSMVGAFVDCYPNLVDRAVEWHAKTRFESNYKQVYELLIDKELWDMDNYFSLENRAKYLCARINHLEESERSRFIKYSEDYSNFYINIGLIDKYGKFIYIAFEQSDNQFKSPQVLDSRVKMKNLGFNEYEADFVYFFENIADVIFPKNTTISDFDLSDNQKLSHIISGRKERLGPLGSALSDVELVSRIQQSIQYALRQNTVDYNFIVPHYNSIENKMGSLIPLFLDDISKNKPAAALLVNNTDTGYQVATVLELKQAYLSARLINKVTASWLIKED